MVYDRELRVILMQIIRELLFNIVKHSGTNEAIIETSGTAEDEMSLSIIDHGEAFDPDAIKHKKSFGLATIMEHLKLFDGTLEIDSAPGRGSSMIIHLPAGQLIIYKNQVQIPVR